MGEMPYNFINAPKVNPVSTPVEILEAEVMKLSNSDRTRILERLITSLDDAEAIEADWIAEALRREASVLNGSEQMLHGAATLARLRARYA